jgi:DNA-binding Lrp family transcriptional regulator
MSQQSNTMDDTDRAILNRLQSDFPITSRPFLTIADDPALQSFDLTETKVLKRINRLKANGIIRRIGGNFVPEKLGFTSTLCAANVPKDMVESFAQVVNSYPGVTHNYQRNNEYNIWFTFIAQSATEIENKLEEISKKTGIDDIINLPASKVFKVKAHFDL